MTQCNCLACKLNEAIDDAVINTIGDLIRATAMEGLLESQQFITDVVNRTITDENFDERINSTMTAIEKFMSSNRSTTNIPRC